VVLTFSENRQFWFFGEVFNFVSSVFQVQDNWPGYQFFGKTKFSLFSNVLVLTNLIKQSVLKGGSP
jgi:hypothetical protein